MNIVLTGFMGSGKSVVGKLLAEKLGWKFVDADLIVEADEKMKISDIFSSKGEPYFRDAETKAVKKAASFDKAVISCGGGVVLRSENLEVLEKTGFVVCLMAKPGTIFERLKNNNDRPLLKVVDPEKRIKELLDERRPFYKRCSLMIDTDDLTQEEVAELILKSVKL